MNLKAGANTVSAPEPDLQWESDRTNPIRRIAFFFALAAIFIRFSVIHEALAVVLNLNLYLLYIVMPPAIVGVVITGGIRRTLAARANWYWLAFLAWLLLAVPFSAWVGGSAIHVLTYARTEYLMFFIVAGLVITWKECLLVMHTLVLAALTDLVVARTFMKQTSDRINLDMGGSTIANSNDFAAHLILLLGFLVFLAVAPKIPTVLRLFSIPALAYGTYMVLSAGSRGALIALLACFIFTFIMGSSLYRTMSIFALPILAVVMVAELPRSTLARLSTIASDSEDMSVQADAEGSTEARRALLKKSLEYTFLHPVFGIGPGRFSDYEGGESQRAGRRGMWHETHNSYTQISSECGIPALIFFLSGIVAAFRLALKTYREACKTPMNRDISSTAFCMMLAMVGFLTAITFANFGYRFYEPAVCALCVVIYSAAQREMATREFRQASAAKPAPLWAPAQPLVSPAFVPSKSR